MKLINQLPLPKWTLFIMMVFLIPNTYAKSPQEIATDLIVIGESVKVFYKNNFRWPRSFKELDYEDLLDELDIDNEVENRSYQLFISEERIAIGVDQEMIAKEELDVYLPSLSSFAGYNWFYIELDIATKNKKKSNEDYYEQILPFVSNIKLMIDGTIFNPSKQQ